MEIGRNLHQSSGKMEVLVSRRWFRGQHPRLLAHSKTWCQGCNALPDQSVKCFLPPWATGDQWDKIQHTLQLSSSYRKRNASLKGRKWGRWNTSTNPTYQQITTGTPAQDTVLGKAITKAANELGGKAINFNTDASGVDSIRINAEIHY